MTPAEREVLRQAEEQARRVLGRAAVLNSLEPLVLAEPCEAERERLLEDLYERLYAASAEPDFARQDLWVMVERIRSEVGLVVPPERGPLGPPPGQPWMHRGALGRPGRDP